VKLLSQVLLKPKRPDCIVDCVGQNALSQRLLAAHFRQPSSMHSGTPLSIHAPQKENGRLRIRANSHYRIVTANPPNPRSKAYRPVGRRNMSVAFRPGFTWPA
jgi:hypothetical protein